VWTENDAKKTKIAKRIEYMPNKKHWLDLQALIREDKRIEYNIVHKDC